MPPPFHQTAAVFASLSRIDQSLGRLSGLAVAQPQPLLRKKNHVRSVQATAAIEGNTLGVEQVTALLEGKRVVGLATELREILNVNDAYLRLDRWKASNRKSLLEAHSVLMTGLMEGAGRFRTSGVGVFRGRKLAHLAPPAHLVSSQVDTLLRWVGRAEASPLVAGCVAHYELLFIHPFLDGNGRVARLWQQVVHRSHSPLLQFVPVESVIRERQSQYYAALRHSDALGHCTPFLEFSLDALADALTAFSEDARPARETAEVRIATARRHFGRRWFSRGEYLRLHPRLSTASASRDVATALASGQVESRGDGRMTTYRFSKA